MSNPYQHQPKIEVGVEKVAAFDICVDVSDGIKVSSNIPEKIRSSNWQPCGIEITTTAFAKFLDGCNIKTAQIVFGDGNNEVAVSAPVLVFRNDSNTACRLVQCQMFMAEITTISEISLRFSVVDKAGKSSQIVLVSCLFEPINIKMGGALNVRFNVSLS
jgi:hypothetical protein